MTDLTWILNQLVDIKGTILIPGIMDDVPPVSDEEKAIYEAIEFDLKSFKKDCGVNGLIHPTCVVSQVQF